LNAKKHLLIVTLALLALTISACGGAESGASSAVLTEAAIIYAQSLTQTAEAAPPTATATPALPTATNTPLPPTATPTVTGTPPTATPSATQQQSQGSGGNTPCLRASFEIETVPDGTQYTVGRGFTKAWRLKNSGSCPWTPNFVAVWVSGELFGADSVTQFTAVNINPGEYVWVEIEMIAPKPAGHYKGYWMLRSDQGVFFGVGITGDEWFWVDIESIPILE